MIAPWLGRFALAVAAVATLSRPACAATPPDPPPAAGPSLTARLDSIPAWPEDLGRLDAAAIDSARTRLERSVSGLPGAGRSAEARYRGALLDLEPLSARDASRARLDLLEIASQETDPAWRARARYAIGWLGEQAGLDDSARAAYSRVVVDGPETEASARARVGLARLLLRRGAAAATAAGSLLQEASELGAAPETLVAELKDLAVRIAGLAPDPAVASVRTDTGLRAPDGFAARPGGGVLVGSRRAGGVVEFDASGVRIAGWNLEDLRALAVNEPGWAYAAAGDAVYRLDPDGRVTRVASSGDFASPTAMAVDAAGGIWLLDRRKERIGRIEPHGEFPISFWEDPAARLIDLVWDGRRLVAIESRSHTVIVIERNGRSQVLLAQGLDRPLGLAADPAGRVAVLDARARLVTTVALDGKLEARAYEAAIVRPVAIELGTDGTIHLFDDADGAWVRIP